MQNPFAHAHFRDRSRPFIVVVCVLMGLLVVGGFAAKPAWRAFKDRRALGFVSAARAAREADDYSIAAAHLRAAHALSPSHPEVLRATGEHFSRLSRSEGLIYWSQLAESGRMTDSDRFAFVRLALDCEDFEAARKAVIPLGQTRPKDPDALRLLAEVYLGFNKHKLAANTLREALDVAPFRADLQVILSRIELAGSDRRLHAGAKGRLWQMVALGGTNQMDSASALLQSGELSATELRLLDSLLRPATNASFDLHLIQLLVSLRLPDTNGEELIEQFRTVTGLREESLNFQRLLTALTAAKEYAVITNLLPTTVIEKHRDLYPFRLEALVGLRDSPGLESTLQVLGERVGPAQASIYIALAASFGGRTNETAQLWQNALSRNANSPPVLKVIAERAEREGAWSTAVAAWDALLLQPEYAVPAAGQLLRLCLNSTDARPALKAYHQLIRLEPHRQDHRLHLAFLQLLYETELESAKATLAQTPEAPLHNLHAVASALALLREHRAETAATILDRTTVNWPTAPRHWQIVRAAILSQTGRFSEARLAVNALRPEELSPPELSLVADLMKKADR